VPFDAQALVDNIQQQAVINEDEGWVQNVPGVIGIPIILALIVSFSLLLIATLVSVHLDNSFTALNAAAAFGCGVLTSLAVAGAVNFYANVLKGLIKKIVESVGAATTIAGVFGVCT